MTRATKLAVALALATVVGLSASLIRGRPNQTKLAQKLQHDATRTPPSPPRSTHVIPQSDPSFYSRQLRAQNPQYQGAAITIDLLQKLIAESYPLATEEEKTKIITIALRDIFNSMSKEELVRIMELDLALMRSRMPQYLTSYYFALWESASDLDNWREKGNLGGVMAYVLTNYVSLCTSTRLATLEEATHWWERAEKDLELLLSLSLPDVVKCQLMTMKNYASTKLGIDAAELRAEYTNTLESYLIRAGIEEQRTLLPAIANMYMDSGIWDEAIKYYERFRELEGEEGGLVVPVVYMGDIGMYADRAADWAICPDYDVDELIEQAKAKIAGTEYISIRDNLRQVSNALGQYQAAHDSKFPESLETLVSEGYLSDPQIIINPATGQTYDYTAGLTLDESNYRKVIVFVDGDIKYVLTPIGCLLRMSDATFEDLLRMGTFEMVK